MAPDASHHPNRAVVPPGHRALRWMAGAAAVLACLLVFGMYTAPHFMVMLADQVWACF
jgi:hypothetical protein